MTKKKESVNDDFITIDDFINECLKRICPILNDYASKADNDGEMLGKLNSACRAIGQLVAMIPGATRHSRSCPSWQVMSSVCSERIRKTNPIKSK
jgi:hypothetical protein